jgi:hypothetical protein
MMTLGSSDLPLLDDLLFLVNDLRLRSVVLVSLDSLRAVAFQEMKGLKLSDSHPIDKGCCSVLWAHVYTCVPHCPHALSGSYWKLAKWWDLYVSDSLLDEAWHACM